MFVTENARKEIFSNAKFLKITIELGGCAGLRYNLEYVNEDSGFITLGDCLVTDEDSLPFLGHIELDFKNELGYQEFVIKNPIAKSNCGCGNSFSM